VTPVERLLRDRIAREGPLSFAEVMHTALYHPRHGYYVRLRGFGADGDFITSPETHPVFGFLIARQAQDLWEALDRPRPLRILEFGGGSGALASSLLDALDFEVDYVIDEVSPSLRALQCTRLGARLSDRPSGPPHLVIANEVLDALPVHRVTVRDGELREVLVDADLHWVEAAATPALQRYFERVGVRPPEGAMTEVNLGIEPWVQGLAARLDRGLALILDYGYPAEALYGRAQGSLLTYYRHTLGSDPLIRLGEQDISSHVDFTMLATCAAQAGLRVIGVTSQSNLLRNLGLGELEIRSTADRDAIANLVNPQGLGRIGALFLGKGLGDFAPAGLSGQRQWSSAAVVPLLPPSAEDDDFLDQWNEAFTANGK
jgi:SAM-dependent MidA family methyltransferase